MAAVVDEQPSSSNSTFSKDEVNKLMGQGMRHFVCNEIAEAVKSFECACLMLNKKYGVLSNECGEAHYQYGRSLLELARLENGVLGSALKEGIEEEVPDYEEDIEMETETNGATSPATPTEISAAGNNNDQIASEETLANECSRTEEGEEKMVTKGSVKKDQENETKSVYNNTTDKKECLHGQVEPDSSIARDMPKESKIDDSKADKKEEIVEGEAGTSEKQLVSKNAEEKMVETAKECMIEKTSSDDNTIHTKNNEKGSANKDHLEQCENKEHKESLNTEWKEVDETVIGQKDNDEQEQKEGEEEQKEGEEEQEENEEKGEENEEKGEEDETTNDGPVSTIQLAWETLELARIIFKRHSNPEIQLKLAQTHLLLGEIHMEQEQFSDAVTELTKCLNIQKNLLQPDDRLLAETYYNLGLAYTLSMMYDESACHYANAIEVLELRVKNIKTRIDAAGQQDKGKSKASDDDPLVNDRKELVELEDILPEIREKKGKLEHPTKKSMEVHLRSQEMDVHACFDAKNENERLKSNIKEKLGLTSGVENSSFSTSGNSCSEKPANDISHLVRKKRKPKDEEDDRKNGEAPTKKARQESEVTTTQPEKDDSTISEAGNAEPSE